MDNVTAALDSLTALVSSDPEACHLLDQALAAELQDQQDTHKATLSILDAFATGYAAQDEPISLLATLSKGQRLAVIVSSLVAASSADASRTLFKIGLAMEGGKWAGDVLEFPKRDQWFHSESFDKDCGRFSLKPQ